MALEREVPHVASGDRVQTVYFAGPVRHGLLLHRLPASHHQRREGRAPRLRSPRRPRPRQQPDDAGGVQQSLSRVSNESAEGPWSHGSRAGRNLGSRNNMANVSGSVYGLTILSPIIDDPKADISHD